ncbi:MAG: zinc ABC transporter substrate-binding protein [Candidatus Riflebacteria bacterium]|nr:zinc ABC transporter substrate-binding protein [Candidatus Riflebacteria bacterium]
MRRNNVVSCAAWRRHFMMLCTALIVGVAGIAFAEASAPAAAATGAKPVVCATFYPLAFFASQIAGNHVHVVCYVPENKDPSSWMPDRDTLVKMQKADLILMNGANYELWAKKVSLPPSKTVIATNPFEKELIRFPNAITHSHGPAGMHTHEGIDGHTWLDPINAITEAETVEKALLQHFPSNEADFAKGFSALKKQFTDLDGAFRKSSRDIQGKILLCTHPAYNYIARRYGWTVETHSINPDDRLDPKDLEWIKDSHAKHPFACVLWESQPKPEIEKAIGDATGLRSIVFSPCELLSADEAKAGFDYFKIMDGNLERFEKAINNPAPTRP